MCFLVEVVFFVVFVDGVLIGVVMIFDDDGGCSGVDLFKVFIVG